ncbi:MAG TPA: hypothetical protein VFQ53_17705 [Kofleriaceae bacterium]|nr:hypothetical protein [Kofleriaceae bacterium]
MRAACVWFATLLACGDNRIVPTDETGDARDGTRLALVHYTYPDGARELDRTRFDDVVRGERCAVTAWSDGLRYCTPVSAGGTVYLDAACTHEIGFASAEQPEQPRYFTRTFSLNGVGSTSRLFRAGPEIGFPEAVYRRRDDACEPAGLGFVRFHELAGEVARDELVEVHDIDLVVGDRLAIVALASEDGMRMPYAVRDRALDVACTPVLDGAPRCEPAGVRAASYFRDDACTVAVVGATADTRPTEIVAVSHDDGCTSFHRLGTHVGPTPLFRRDGAACVATTSADYLYLVGDPVMPASLEVVTHARPGARLDEVIARGEGAPVPSGTWLDRELGTPCARVDVFGTERCMPALARAEVRFADDACTTRIAVSDVRTSACGPATSHAERRDTTIEFFAIGDVAAVYDHDATGACSPYVPAPGHEVHRLGEPFSVDAFAPATLEAPP